MGRSFKFNNSPMSQKMNHFSHPHELQLWSFPSTISPPSAICSCCKLPPHDPPVYICIAGCNFFLHLSCAQYPQLITHPSHRNHTLALFPTAAYPGGVFKCDACNRQGNGFSYHCSSCEFDLHVTCASKPLQITHPFHSPCPLELTFTNPYDNAKGFSCDVCHKIGYNEWLYRCKACEFDVHLDCTTVGAPPAPVVVQGGGQVAAQFLHGGSTGSVQNPVMGPGQVPQILPHHHLTHSASMGATPMTLHQFQPGNAAAVLQRPNFVHSASTAQVTTLMSSVLQGLVEGTSQGVGQGLEQGMIGGGSSGGGGGGGAELGAIFGDSSEAQN